MIEIRNLGVCSKAAAALTDFLKNGIKQKETAEKSIEEYRKNEVPEILNTAGANIALPFRPKKTPEWKKYREFDVPAGLHLGISSGETYFALSKGKNAGGTLIHKVADTDYFEYGYTRNDGREEYINFNIGVSREFMYKTEANYKNETEALVQKKIAEINA